MKPFPFFAIAFASASLLACGQPNRSPDAGDGSIGSGCSGHDFQGDQVVDLQLHSVRFEGSVTLDGAALPADLTGAVLQFRNHETGAFGEVRLENGAFSVPLQPGRYDVSMAAFCTLTSPTALCGIIPLASAFEVGATPHVFDAHATHVRGQLRVNGAAVRFSTVNVVLQSTADAAPARFELPIDADGNFDAMVSPGHYDVWTEGTGNCFSDLQIPCVNGPTGTAVDVTSGADLGIDLTTVRLDFTFTHNGATTPTFGRAFRLQHLVPGGSYYDFNSDSSISTSVYPGSYSLRLMAYPATAPTRCDGMHGLPCHEVVLASSFDVRTSMARQFDIPSVRLQGHFTIDGVVPTGRASGGLTLRASGDPNAPEYHLDGDYPAFDTRVSPATYDVAWGRSIGCPTGGAPCAPALIARDVALTTDTTREFDMHTFPLTIEVTQSSAPLADVGRGSISIRGAGALEPAVHRLSATGAASITIPVIAGHYSIEYTSDGVSTCDSILCGAVSLRDDAAVDATQTLRFDVPAARPHGRILLDGQPTQVGLRFRNVRTGSVADYDLSASTYAHSIAPGPTVIVARGPTLVDQVVAGCE